METEWMGSTCDSCRVCHGFRPHSWRAACRDCKCKRSEHIVLANRKVPIMSRLRLGWSLYRLLESAEKQLAVANAAGFACSPLGLQRSQMLLFSATVQEATMPSLTSAPACRERLRRLHAQMPPQDASPAACSSLELNRRRQLRLEVARRNSNSLGLAEVAVPKADDECAACKTQICVQSEAGDESASFVLKVTHSPDSVWHPACFRCSVCRQPLVDFWYCWDGQRPLCVRHFNETVRPRCCACDELIFSPEFARTRLGDYHVDHFCCSKCERTLSGRQYLLNNETPYCSKCYEEKFGTTCYQCDGKIAWHHTALTYDKRQWHSGCFKCSDCGCELADREFLLTRDQLLCGGCHDVKFGARCRACAKPFEPGVKKFEFNGRLWHSACFVCQQCRRQIGSRKFMPVDSSVFCIECYDAAFARECAFCSQLVRGVGVQHDGRTFHLDCLHCSKCRTRLAGVKFVVRGNDTFCRSCYSEVNSCQACKKPIDCEADAAKSQFVSFDSRYWHAGCFSCDKCGVGLAGKDFEFNDESLLCLECRQSRI